MRNEDARLVSMSTYGLCAGGFQASLQRAEELERQLAAAERISPRSSSPSRLHCSRVRSALPARFAPVTIA